MLTALKINVQIVYYVVESAFCFCFLSKRACFAFFFDNTISVTINIFLSIYTFSFQIYMFLWAAKYKVQKKQHPKGPPKLVDGAKESSHSHSALFVRILRLSGISWISVLLSFCRRVHWWTFSRTRPSANDVINVWQSRNDFGISYSEIAAEEILQSQVQMILSVNAAMWAGKG